MKGDLNTLKKVCKYGSTVMLAGVIVLAALIAVLLAIGVWALFSDGYPQILLDWLDLDGSVSAKVLVSSYLLQLLILIMGLITVWEVYKIMNSAKSEYTPFLKANADRIKLISLTFLFSSVLLAILVFLSDGGWKMALFMFLGSLLVSVVMYCLTIVIRYGVLLQKESDETL